MLVIDRDKKSNNSFEFSFSKRKNNQIMTKKSVKENKDESPKFNAEMDPLNSFQIEDNHEAIVQLLLVVTELTSKINDSATKSELLEKYKDLFKHIQNVTVATAKLEERVKALEEKYK